MKQYENLEHTADLKIRSFGKTKEEVFLNMAKGMFANICDEAEKLKDQPVEIELKVQATDLPSLLVDFLNQLVYLCDVNNEVYADYDLAIMEKTTHQWVLEGVARGFKITGLELEIKAVTYNELKIEEDEKGNWLAEVVFDI
jgi:SHS2 domain-containing protein